MATNLSELVTPYGAQDLIVQTLKDHGYTGDLSRGSPLYQLLVEPHSVIYSMNVSAQDALRNAWTLLSRPPDGSSPTDQEALVNLFSNLRLSPSAGAKAQGHVQLTFNNNEVRTVTVSTVFISVGGSQFFPKENYTLVPSEDYRSSFSATELVYTRTAAGYAVDIEVESGTTGITSISSGEIFTTTFPGLLEARASSSFTSGRPEQSVADLIREIPDILSETSMLSPVSLTSYLYNEFPSTQDVRVFRSGEPEMRRAFNTALGVAVPSADVVVLPSVRPGTSRKFIPGYVELYVDPEDNAVYNGTHFMGYAEPGVSDNVDIVLMDRVWIEGVVTDRDVAGLHHVFSAGIRQDTTEPTTGEDPDTPVQDGVSILSRSLVQDDRYGNLPVIGADPRDFYFSSYQDRVKFEFTAIWQDIEEEDPEGFNKIKTWVDFWSAAEGGRDALAEAYGVEDESAVPRLLRVEVPIYVDVVYFSDLHEMQMSINREERRCYGQDYVIKSPNLVSVSVSLVVSKELDFMVFREDYFKSKIADFINSKGLRHSGTITKDQIKALIFEEAPRGSDELFEIEFNMRMRVPDESLPQEDKWISETSDHIDYIQVPQYGITERNTVFSCSQSQIGVQYR